ncbi:MAG: UPF0149 family protein [Candidatus Thiodiazotropha sp.]
MTDNFPVPDFARLEQVLSAVDFDYPPSELHGVITGLVCAGSEQVQAVWMGDLLGHLPDDDLLAQEARQLVGQLYGVTLEQIGHTEMMFMPLLPDESRSISDRARCLSEWCEGYLYGLGVAGITERQLVGDAREALQDLTHFTRIDYAGLESGEATEMAYVELQEFLKVVTMLMWEELADNRERQDATE